MLPLAAWVVTLGAPLVVASESVAAPAYYIVFERHGDGSVTPVFASIVNLHTPLQSLPADEVLRRELTTTRGMDLVAIAVRDAADHVVWMGSDQVNTVGTQQLALADGRFFRFRVAFRW